MQMTPVKRHSLSSGFGILVSCALLLLAGVALLRKLFDPDVWFHLTVGREVVRQMRIPAQEFYILPRLGEPGEFHEWGFGVFYYGVERLAGYAGMAVVNAALGCAILLFLYFAARSRTRFEWWQPLPVMALALWAIEPRLNFRPETVLYLLLAAEIWLLENYLTQKKPAWLIPLPFFSCLLSQCHPSAIFLIGVLGMYGVQAVLAAEKRAATAATLGAVAFAMAGAAALNPYGLHQLLMPFHTLGETELLKSVNEFLPVMETVYAPYFIALAVAGAIAILFSPQRRLTDVLLFLVFGFLAYRYARNIALFGIVMLVAINHTFASWVARLARGGARSAAIASLAVAVGLAGIARVGGSGAWGVGIDDEMTPQKNAQLLQRLAVQGNILNFFHLGSYLAWALERPVFVDGKNYGMNEAVKLHDGIFGAAQGWQRVVGSFDIQAIVTPATLTISGKIIPLVADLADDAGWAVAGRERAGLLFIRDRGQEGIPRLPREAVWQQAIEELENTIQTYPGSEEAHASLAVAQSKLRPQ